MRRLRIIRETIKEESKGKWVSANDVLKCDPMSGEVSSIPSHFIDTCEQLELLYEGLQLHYGKERLGKKNASKGKE
jgi:hypothetical protein